MTRMQKRKAGRGGPPSSGPNAGERRLDNEDIDTKLALRRHFLERYHGHSPRPPKVLDACQASGRIWAQLRTEYKVHYWGVDRVQQRGRLAIDSVRLLTQPNLPYDIIDVDTYGSPWEHWRAMLPNVRRPTTVFLTLGHVGNITDGGAAVLDVLGLAKLGQRVPKSLQWKLAAQFSVGACLALAYRWGLKFSEAVEALPAGQNTRYFGVHLHP